ncbi:MAG: DUF1016 family protein [Actinomycetaceae bacterium]|nr:DUF1016 family protein [Actinomycetaceae bacterium]
MSNLMKQDESYAVWIAELKERYRAAQIKASVAVNIEMLSFYWKLGRDIHSMQAENRYGSDFYEMLSQDLCSAITDAKGFSPRNLRYMKSFYELFPENMANLPQVEANLVSAEDGDEVNLPQVVAESDNRTLSLPESAFPLIPWGHIRTIIDKCKGDREKALFYARKTLENNWSRAVLLNFLSTDLYDRQGKAVSNFTATLPEPHGDLAQEITKDPYSFNFLTIQERYNERELKDALMDNITAFLLELGRGFAFVGREYRLRVGETEQFIDLLFYHIHLRCYVVVEVKAVPFEPGFIGQLGTYVSAVNHILAEENDQPALGLLICRNKDDVLVRYALEGSKQPIGISEYELTKLIPDEFKGSMPTIEEIEAELSGLEEMNNEQD